MKRSIAASWTTHAQSLVRVIAVCLLAYGVYAVGQDSPATNITGGGAKGKIPVFTGAHSIGNSIMSQASGKISVNGSVAASASSGAVVSGTTSSTAAAYGVSGSNDSSTGVGAGTYGQNSTSGESLTGAALLSTGVVNAGVWGDGGGGASVNNGVQGTTDNRNAGFFENNNASFYTIFGQDNSDGYPFGAFNTVGGCYIDPTASFFCTGSKNAVVAIDEGRHKVALSAIESPMNWFEDFGSAYLSSGAAVVQLELKFAQTVNTEKEYHVFLTPNGDCRGLYVTQKTATSFEVHELGGGTSGVKFDYRIVALRKNYENIRLADHTHVVGANGMGRAIAEK